jgi:poly(3-hydroxybutyrate) depolymerase
MDSQGYIYVPRHCHRQRCYLHFYFHGCLNGREFNGTDHIVNSGYLDVAEANNLIIVFPQAISSMENMVGCWDTYGLTSGLYGNTQTKI